MKINLKKTAGSCYLEERVLTSLWNLLISLNARISLLYWGGHFQRKSYKLGHGLNTCRVKPAVGLYKLLFLGCARRYCKYSISRLDLLFQSLILSILFMALKFGVMPFIGSI